MACAWGHNISKRYSQDQSSLTFEHQPTFSLVFSEENNSQAIKKHIEIIQGYEETSYNPSE